MTQLPKAEKRLLELGITEPHEIELEPIALLEGVHVKYDELKGCEARLIGVNDRAIVTIRDGIDERRKRFSLAHELGHWNCHRGRSFECRVDDLAEGYLSKPVEEKEADKYAADLLMPSYMFKPRAKSLKRPTFDSVIELSKIFNTSLTATAIRLVDMNIWPLMIVCHTQQRRTWFNRSPDIPIKWFPKNEVDADSIAFDRLFGDAERTRAQKIGADAWFDRFDAERYDITEDAIRISRNEVLTLLWLENDGMLED